LSTREIERKRVLTFIANFIQKIKLKTAMVDYKKMTAPCGIPCFECIAYKANSNEAIRKRISENLGMDYDKSACDGCRNRNGIGFLSEKNNVFPEGKCLLMNDKGVCKIYLCTQEKQIHNCSECDDFPCDNLQPFADRANRIPHNLKIYNLSLIKKIGLEKWAKEKAQSIMISFMTKKLDS